MSSASRGGGCAVQELADTHRPCDVECLNNNKEAAAVLLAAGPGLKEARRRGEIFE
jgi:hypothetical protein